MLLEIATFKKMGWGSDGQRDSGERREEKEDESMSGEKQTDNLERGTLTGRA